MHVYGTISATLTPSGTLNGTLSANSTLSASMSIPSVAHAPRYDGAYSFTPSTEEQTIPIQNLMARRDIVIEKIPSNYGLITWNGSTLTVS